MGDETLLKLNRSGDLVADQQERRKPGIVAWNVGLENAQKRKLRCVALQHFDNSI